MNRISALACILAVAVIVTMTVAVAGDTGGVGHQQQRVLQNGETVDQEAQLMALREAVAANPYADESVLPDLVASYVGEASNPDAPPLVRAMSWLLFDDPAGLGPTDELFVDRFVLVVLYYAMGGENWINSSGWLQEANPCSWYGIVCSLFDPIVREINLPANNLVGSIPPEMNMLSTVRVIVLRNNEISGSIPSLELGTMPTLSILYLNSNQLTGTVSADLRANGVLSTLFVYDNNLTGLWPRRSFCPRTGDPSILENFGLDCGKIVGCPPGCCGAYQCF